MGYTIATGIWFVMLCTLAVIHYRSYGWFFIIITAALLVALGIDLAQSRRLRDAASPSASHNVDGSDQQVDGPDVGGQ